MRRILPVLVLLLLSPLIAEILLGATGITRVGLVLSDIGFYGTGTVLVRELVRQRKLGWWSLLLLGAAFGVLEEGVILQTVFNPTFYGLGDLSVYGRVLGVNWVWAELIVIYHTFTIASAIVLTELLFPSRRTRKWLGKVGIWVVSLLFLLSSSTWFASFLLSTHGYVLPLLPTVGAVILVCLLIWLALRPQHFSHMPSSLARHVPYPWMVCIFGFLATGAYFAIWEFLARKTSPFPAPITILLLTGLVLAVGVLVRYWTAPGRQWSDIHSLALITGPILVIALEGNYTLSSQPDKTGDFIGLLIVSVLMILFLLALAYRMSTRGNRSASPAISPDMSSTSSQQVENDVSSLLL